jgi:hypothetical protein
MSLAGGCMCGSVRYELASDPFDCGWCHCRTCQLFGGAPAMAFASVATDHFHWSEGEEQVRWIESSTFGRRAFCGNCGTPLQVRVDHQPETIDFPVATLDDPAAAAPEFHIFWGSKVSWFDPGDALPRHHKFRPDTRGLSGTEPPDESSMVGGAAQAAAD